MSVEFEDFIHYYTECNFCGTRCEGWSEEEVLEKLEGWLINQQDLKLFCPICGLDGRNR